MTSGVQIGKLKANPTPPPALEYAPACTAGPMLIKGYETYLLTAGHCFGAYGTEGNKKEAWFSQWPNVLKEEAKEIGNEVSWYWNKELDVGEIKITRTEPLPGPWTNLLPNPVPALMVEWGSFGKKGEAGWKEEAVREEGKAFEIESHSVFGERVSLVGDVNCHEGQKSGEQCGQVTKVEGVVGPRPENLVEDTACGEAGDSGGPWFERSFGEVFIQGTHKGGEFRGAPKKCNPNGEPVEGRVSWYEPIRTILKEAFPGQRLLTKFNEVRKPRVMAAISAVLSKKAYTSTSGAATIETVGGAKLTCTADSGEGEASAESSGTAKLTLTGCKDAGAKCRTAGAAKGEVILGANYELAFIKGSINEVGLLLNLTEATIKCGKKCNGNPVETLKLRGTGIGVATPINEEVVPAKKFTIAFSEVKGVQTPTEYETEEGAKAKAILEMEGSGANVFGFEQAGISDADELLFEETAEIEG